jgi:AcrR family transcriptional regulator
MDSHIYENRRKPQQERSEKRVVELLEAAAQEFADVGYGATTVKAIAKRAKASIGAVYQYFPDKASVANALRSRYADEIQERWKVFEEASREASLEQRVHGFVDLMVVFMGERPAYLTLLDAPAEASIDVETKMRIRGLLASVFQARRSNLLPKEADRIAGITLEMIKGMNTLYLKAKRSERAEIIREYKLVLTFYLRARLSQTK